MAEKDEIFLELDQSGKIVDKVYNEDIILDFSLIKHTFEKHNQLLFKGITFNGNFNFINFNYKYLFSIVFEGCCFYKGVDFIDISEPLELFKIRNCVFYSKSSIVFSAIQVDVFEFDDNNLRECLMYSILTSYMQIRNCNILTEIGLYEIEGDYAKIENIQTNVCSQIRIQSPKLKEVDIESNNLIGSINIFKIQNACIFGDVNKINIFASDFDSITLNNVSGKINPKKDAKISELRFQDTNFQGLLTLEDLEIDQLVFSGLNMTNGSVRFNEIAIKETIIHDCSISNFYWNQVKFINPPDISRSDLSELKMANVLWQNNKQLKNSFLDEKIPLLYVLRKKWLKKSNKDFDYENISELKYQIETYRQLKAASISNHNPIEGLTFYRNEMKLYWKLIRIEGGIPWYDRFLVFLNRIVSDFGQNWFLPLFWISFTTILFYFKIEQPTLSYKPLDIWNGILEVLYYVNPVRKVDESLPKAAQGLDVLLRVVNAYFIYHFIKASRKFGKM